MRVDFAPDALHAVGGQLLELRQQVAFKANTFFSMVLVEIVLEVLVRELVA